MTYLSCSTGGVDHVADATVLTGLRLSLCGEIKMDRSGGACPHMRDCTSTSIQNLRYHVTHTEACVHVPFRRAGKYFSANIQVLQECTGAAMSTCRAQVLHSQPGFGLS